MKRIYYVRAVLSFVAIVAVMVACTDSYPTLIYEKPETGMEGVNKDGLTDRTPVLLFVNSQDFFSISATRGSGPFPPEDNDPAGYQNGIIYVYAFRSGYNMQGTVLTSLPSLRNTAYATLNRPDDIVNDSTDFADCLLDDSDYCLGVPTKLIPESSGELLYNYHYEKDENGQDVLKFGNQWGRDFYYSSAYQETPYRFFAYYVDDFMPNVSNTHREDTHIHYDITIDGAQDIMCGVSTDLNTVLTTRYSEQFERLSPAEQNAIRNIGGYSKFTADRDIHPFIEMKHQLTRLKFVAYPADELTNNLVITGIEVRCRNQADMTVATRDFENYPLGLKFNDNYANLSLRMDYPDTLKVGTKSFAGYVVEYKPEMAEQEWAEREHRQIGESLILSPDSTYELYIHAAQKVRINEAGDVALQPFTSRKIIKLTGSEKLFKPGYIYTINMAVYGQRKIEVYTSVEDWKSGGEVFVDDDEE